MQRASIVRVSVAVITAGVFCAFVALDTSSYVSADSTFTCSDGSTSKVATAEQAASVPGGTITAGVTMVCPSDIALGISGAVGTAKTYLLSIARGLPNSKAPPDATHINELNDTFAVCAANFLQAYAKQYGPVTISSAFRCGPRSPAIIHCNPSENANAGGASGSNHQIGLAMDVNPAGGKSSYDTLMNFAKSNPAFGICFPRPSFNGSPDLPHMILAGENSQTGSEGAACSAQGVTKPCSGAPAFVATPAAPATPAQGLAGLLGLNGQQCQAGYTMVNGTCTPSSTNGAPVAGQVVSQDTVCVVSTNPPITQIIPAGSVYPAGCLNTSANNCTAQQYCSGNTIMSQSSTCTVTSGQVCQYGCSNGACKQQQQPRQAR